MFVVVALVICAAIGLVGGNSRIGKCGWIGAALAAMTIVVVACGYHYDARQLPEWQEKRNDLLKRLRTNKICVDMETHPENWRGKELEYPCVGYGADELQSQISDEEDVLEDWNRTIRDREVLLKERENGQFWFLQKWFGDPYG